MKTKMLLIAIAAALSGSLACGADDEVPGWSMPGDTVMKIADPGATRQKIDRLAEQDHWTDFATAQQIKLFEGPETDWAEVPSDQYDTSGLSRTILGSKVPPPGVHPRILFSPQDISVIREKIVGTKQWVETECQMKKTILDPESGDGKVFAKLASGDLEGLEFPDDGSKGANGRHVFEGYPIGIYAAHVCYWPRNLNAIGFYALMKGDDELGKRVANAVVNYYRLREPLIDKQNARGDDPNAPDAWPADLWRQMHYVAGEGHLGLAYDMAGKWMTPRQKDFMRRIVIKATADSRSYGANGPVRWRDTNWVGWDTQHVISHLAIEGEEGFDPEIVANGAGTIYGYLTYGISPYGTIFETNGKNRAGFQFAMTTAVALARRGHEKLLGHPHLRKLSASQVQQVVPAGGRSVNNGTYGCGPFLEQAAILKNLYPDDKAADWLIQSGKSLGEPTDLEAYRQELMKQSRLYGIHPITADTYLQIARFDGVDGKEPWERDYLNLPLDFEDPHHGQLDTRSSNDKDAVFMMIEARPNLYTVGHQHHDAGHFYLSADGVNWGVEGNDGIRSSRFHSVVLIDGMGQGPNEFGAAKAKWLGAVTNDNGAIATTDLKHAYDWIWTTPMHYTWHLPARKAREWEPETDPEVVSIFKGTERYKARIWMHSYWHENWGPTMRSRFNPVKHAYRTAGIVRGKNPYAIVVDDINKDDNVHLYDWQMQLPQGVTNVSWWKMPAGLTMLAREDDIGKDGPKDGSPCLAVLILNRDKVTSDLADIDIRRQLVSGTSRLVISARAVDPRFRIALVPFRFGEPIPTVKRDGQNGTCTLTWTQGQGENAKIVQQDVIRANPGDDGRTRLSIERGGKKIITVD